MTVVSIHKKTCRYLQRTFYLVGQCRFCTNGNKQKHWIVGKVWTCNSHCSEGTHCSTSARCLIIQGNMASTPPLQDANNSVRVCVCARTGCNDPILEAEYLTPSLEFTDERMAAIKRFPLSSRHTTSNFSQEPTPDRRGGCWGGGEPTPGINLTCSGCVVRSLGLCADWHFDRGGSGSASDYQAGGEAIKTSACAPAHMLMWQETQPCHRLRGTCFLAPNQPERSRLSNLLARPLIGWYLEVAAVNRGADSHGFHLHLACVFHGHLGDAGGDERWEAEGIVVRVRGRCSLAPRGL